MIPFGPKTQNLVGAAGLRLPPLSHHPACGSTPGGSRQITELGLSSRLRDAACGSQVLRRLLSLRQAQGLRQPADHSAGLDFGW